MNHSHRVPVRAADGSFREPSFDARTPAFLLRLALWASALVFVAISFRISEVSLGRLIEGIPRMLQWLATGWPPRLENFDAMLLRAFETVAIATAGTVVATVLAFPLSVLIARNTAPFPRLAAVLRAFADGCRAIDTVVFAILFVAAVGLGPFAGVLGMIVHSVGVIAKLNREAIETLPAAPLEAATMAGANRTKLVSYALLPAVMPNLASVALYVWEANVRTSTVLGLVGAGGIGMEIKAAIDLLDFQKLFTLTAIVLVMVSLIDRFSSWLRKRLV